MKIAELAKKLDLKPGDLRKKIITYGFDIGKKARTIKDKTAEEVEEKIQKERDVLEETRPEETNKEEKVVKKSKKKVLKTEIPEVITVKEFSSKLNLPVTEVIRELVKNGVMAAINENIDYETAAIIAEDLGFKVKPEKIQKEIIPQLEESGGEIKERPPVVTIIGHIDHGKTSLLDYIRKTKVVAGESGGITQHIGAYQIELEKDKKITFLDTPGHEAFEAMREHGTKIADIAILVVAANEGVMPQTKEAIKHAKSAGVPIIVAITKIDKPESDIEKVKKQLARVGLNPEDWGGTTIMVPVSAKTGEGVPDLLEMILLAADMEKIKACYSGKAIGIIIESHLDSNKGPVATVLIQRGVLKLHDSIVTSDIFGKIRIIENFTGKKIKEALPSEPVRIYGLNSVPDFGELIHTFPNNKEAKNFIIDLQKKKLVKSVIQIKDQTKVSKKGMHRLNLIIKADVAGSLKAVVDALKKIRTKNGEVFIISAGVGNISESDIMTAEATQAFVIGFRVITSLAASELAREKKIKILSFQVIYELIDQVRDALSELMGPIKFRKEIGLGKVLAIFRKGKTNNIIGVKVNQGKLIMDAEIENYREDQSIGVGKIVSLKVKDNNKSEVESGNECGIGIEGGFEIKIGDKIKVFEIKEKTAKIE